MKKVQLFIGLLILISCTKIDDTVYQSSTNTYLSLHDTTIINLGDVDVTLIDSSHTDIHVSFNPTIEAYYIDSSKTFINVHVDGPTINEGDILLQVIDTTTNNTTINQGDINISIPVQIDEHGDSLVINNNYNQITCPFTQCTCKIKNCKKHCHRPKDPKCKCH